MPAKKKTNVDSYRDSYEKMLSLLRSELWQQPLDGEVLRSDVEDVIAVSRQQAVSGLVANAIIDNQLPIGDDLAMTVCGIRQKHERKSKAMDAEVAKFAGFLNRRNLEYVIVKGQTMAALYPHPEVRTTGDIDFYVPKSDFERVQKVIEERLNIVMRHNASKKHDNFEIEGFAFEMHSDMTDFGYWKYQKCWNGFFDDAIRQRPTTVSIAGEAVKTLSPTLDALYIFVHAFYHLILNGNGMGLKQYCDWCMVMHHLHDQIDFESLGRYLEGLHLKKAFLAVGAFCVEKLGLPESDLHFPLTAEARQWPEKMMSNLFEARAFSEKIRVKGGVSLLHSLATSRIVAKQVKTYFPLSPMELLFRIPEMAAWSFKKRFVE